MSEEKICPKCKKPLGVCQCSVITLAHEGLPSGQTELERLKEENEGLSQIVEIASISAFEKEKKAFLDQIPQKERREELEEKIGDDPEVLVRYQEMGDFFVKKLEEVGVKVTRKSDGDGKIREPMGESGIPPYNPSRRGDKNWQQIVGELYSIMLDPQKSEREREFANQKVGELFLEMEKGLKKRQEYSFLSVSQCPECKALLTANAESCQKCGWKHLVPKHLR